MIAIGVMITVLLVIQTLVMITVGGKVSEFIDKVELEAVGNEDQVD